MRLRIHLLLCPLVLFLQGWINLRQPEPYMDELFHVPQAQAFCSWNWSYNENITTPPGAYLPVAMIGFAIKQINLEAGEWVCSTAGLRLWNMFLWIMLVELLIVRTKSEATAIALALHPVLLFYSTLFYTDLTSLLLCLAAWELSRAEKRGYSALVGAAATLTRQSSALWHFFIAAEAACFIAYNNPTVRSEFSFDCKSLLGVLQRQRRSIVMKLWPHIVAGVGYPIAALVNGGIMIGDQDRHEMVLHFPMVVYFAVYWVAFTTPLLGFLNRYRRWPRVPAVIPSLMSFLFLALLSAMWLYCCFYVHPFVLADNRHFVFYVYRKILLRSSWSKYALVPFMALGSSCLLGDLQIDTFRIVQDLFPVVGAEDVPTVRRRRTAVRMFFILTLILVLVPSGLVEPRYFITPFIFGSLLALESADVAELFVKSAVAVSTIISGALLYIFLEMPFDRAPDAHMPNDLSPGRFMI
mmetsp:Transcript_9427/g.40842  ORF Transcript_9427/g.40842 Transcript_9427/m.40842 type:complete len:468 (-) Transcript_9427:1899-3302(-)